VPLEQTPPTVDFDAPCPTCEGEGRVEHVPNGAAPWTAGISYTCTADGCHKGQLETIECDVCGEELNVGVDKIGTLRGYRGQANVVTGVRYTVEWPACSSCFEIEAGEVAKQALEVERSGKGLP